MHTAVSCLMVSYLIKRSNFTDNNCYCAQLLCTTASLQYSKLVTGTHRHYLVARTTVLRGQYKSGQVTWQLQPFEVPHQVPEDDRVLVNNTRGRDGLVALVDQQALQFLPQDQGAQVGHCHWRWGRDSCPALGFLGCRHFGCRTEQRRCALLCNRITFLGRPEREARCTTDWRCYGKSLRQLQIPMQGRVMAFKIVHLFNLMWNIRELTPSALYVWSYKDSITGSATSGLWFPHSGKAGMRYRRTGKCCSGWSRQPSSLPWSPRHTPGTRRSYRGSSWTSAPSNSSEMSKDRAQNPALERWWRKLICASVVPQVCNWERAGSDKCPGRSPECEEL